MIRFNFSYLFCIVSSQVVLRLLTYKLWQWADKNSDSIRFSNTFFIIGLVFLLAAAYTGVDSLFICQLAVLLVLAYMDYKIKEVYSFLILIYIVISVFITILNYEKGIFPVVLGFLFFLFSFVKLYAKADGAVMFGIVQAIAVLEREYLFYSVICFIVAQCLITVYYLAGVIFKNNALKLKNNIPVIPFITATYYIWLILHMVV